MTLLIRKNKFDPKSFALCFVLFNASIHYCVLFRLTVIVNQIFIGGSNWFFFFSVFFSFLYKFYLFILSRANGNIILALIYVYLECIYYCVRSKFTVMVKQIFLGDKKHLRLISAVFSDRFFMFYLWAKQAKVTLCFWYMFIYIFISIFTLAIKLKVHLTRMTLQLKTWNLHKFCFSFNMPRYLQMQNVLFYIN